ncbi:MAG TPA: nicotinamide-nucleotide amidase [Gammaproteobacteria bacterium]|nr:nicotinamide-nucleotide amidase [Gammaproteobacteria bacterium]
MQNDDTALLSLSTEVGRRLQSAGLRLAVAESCTGGWIAKCLTDIAGSSAWFERGFVTYSNAAKQEQLGVSAETLSLHGAVSEACVREMATGALRHSQAQVAIAVSGIAGPDGGTRDKPVGTVWIAWHWATGEVEARRSHFTGDRAAVRFQAVRAAFEGLRDGLSGR